MFDEIADVGPRRHLTNLRRIAIERPNRAVADVTGETASRTLWFDKGRLTVLDKEENAGRQILELMTGIADALACAHQAAILHRDVKPENILVARQGYAKLADFGLAKLVEPDSGEEAVTRDREELLTRAGVVVGTVPYMAPEQLSGAAVDARADIFSFGCVLYELLAGRRPFTGATATEVMKAIEHETPAPLGSVRADIPTEWWC